DVARPDDALALRGRRNQVRVHRGENLQGGRLPDGVDPPDLGLGPGDLALVAIEEAERNAEAEPHRVVGADPLVLDLWGDVKPGIGPGQAVVGARPLAVGFRRAE